MNTYLYYTTIFIVSVLAALALIATVSAQLILGEIISFGVDVSLSDRVSTSVHDFVGLLPFLGTMLAIGLLYGFLIAGLVVKRTRSGRGIWYCLAGALSFLCMITLMKFSFDLTPLAAARHTSGLLLLASCCAVAGALFHYLTLGRYQQRVLVAHSMTEVSS